MPLNTHTLSPYSHQSEPYPRRSLPELHGNELRPRHELAGRELHARHASDGHALPELAATGRSRSLRPSRHSDVTDRTTPGFLSLCALADAVIRDPAFQVADKHRLEDLIYAHYQTYPLSPAEAGEVHSRHTPEQYREIFGFMEALAGSATEVMIHMAAPGRSAMSRTPFQAVWDVMLSGDERERHQLYTSDFIIKPRTSPNETAAARFESQWVELSITVRSQHVRALAKVLVNMVSRPENRCGPGMLKQALLVGAGRQDTSCVTAILHFSEAGVEHASAQEKIVHEMLLRETGATLSGLYATCPPGWESLEPGHGTACLERSSTRFPELDSGRLISHILADAISESHRYNIDIPDAISEHWAMNGYTGASLAPLHAHMLPHRRSHSASAISRLQQRPPLAANALQEHGFRSLFEMTQRIAKDPACSSGDHDHITRTVYQYYTNFPCSPEEAHRIRSNQTPKELAKKIDALDALSNKYAGTVDIYMKGIGDGERLRPGDALKKLSGTDGYETARKKVCNTNLIIARAGMSAPIDQNAVLSVLSISVKEKHALTLAEVLTEIFSTQIIANTRIDGMVYAEFSKIVSLSTRAETAAIHFVKPDFEQMAKLAERVDQGLMERISRQGAEAIPGSELYGEFPSPSLTVRRGMIYWEIPPNTGREVVPSLVQAMSNAIFDNKQKQKDLATALYQQLEEMKHLPTNPPFVSLADDKAPHSRVRDCTRKLRSRTREEMEGLQVAPARPWSEYGQLRQPDIRITPAELSAD